ncbi:MAG: Rpn family recombination-promoting nuclease/putative transposase [Tannerella sp.]|nr:Rpn family recombination-promoting nuclease/putative transposase [Tannerella sp.]
MKKKTEIKTTEVKKTKVKKTEAKKTEEQDEIKTTYIHPLTDFGFKKLFATEANKELLIDFLNEVLKEAGLITDIQYMPTFQLGRLENDRKAVFDIFCTNDKKEYFVVEMQKAKEPYFVDRSLFYSTFPIQSQAPQGVWDFNLKPVYVVSILDFKIFEEKEDAEHVIERIYLMRERTQERFSNKLNFVYVELPKFNKAITELETNMDRWLFCLKNLQSLDQRPKEVQGRVFERLFKAAEIKQLTSEEMETYKQNVTEYNDIRRCIAYAAEQNLIKGEQIGLMKGEQIGLMKGRRETNFLIYTNLRTLGVPDNTIPQFMGLSEDEVAELEVKWRSSLNN